MPYQLSLENQVINVVFNGHIGTEDLVALDKEIYEQWTDLNCIGHLYNYLDVQSASFSEEEIRRIALLDKNESFIQGPLKIAIVVEDENIIRFSRIYIEGLTGSDWQAEIFADCSTAMNFLLD
ncbi:hypothetical protein [Planctobacterium marinum]|uniref:hypothetical protein n=1 Tax=Planctobacterium marinum TaxID=1631968 RepID=UPI001E400EFF|nr:hypothetical protein [Planctobacterium marinum]MCC2606991.1 hypothetical protein [Planctobacterium marinum]